MEISAICHDNGRVVTLSDRAADYTRKAIVTCNEKMLGCLSLLESIAATDLRIMIVGEPGCNKQDYAEYIHRISSRAEKPYIRFDCAATHESQYEERLFGSVRTAPDGQWVRRGALEAASGGTVLLDGASAIPGAFYDKLERMLESGTIVRRGGREKTAVDVRMLATCGEDLMMVLHKDRQLAMLLQQLSAVRVDVLPLRQRKEDVALLTLHYLHEANERYGTNKRMGSALFQEILAYTWPGNERELRSFVEQMVLVSPGEVLDDPTLIRSTARLTASLLPAWKKADDATRGGERSLKEQVNEYEVMIIRRSISKYGSLRKAAKALQVDPSVLSRKLSAAKE
jgi:DNA-binding NtrC family response regulator